MEQYLLDLIKNNNRVIVPNFGAFIVSRDAGTTVLFNNFLSFNDGLLINHISKEKGIDTNEATQQVTNFVDKVKQELDRKGEYTFEKLGRFTKDQNGILRFTQDAQIAKLLPGEKEKKDDSALLDIDNEASEESKPNQPEGKKTEPEAPKKADAASAQSKPQLNQDKKSATENTKTEKKQPEKKQKTVASPKKPVPPPTTAKKVDANPPEEYDHKKSMLPPWVIALLILIPLIVLLLLYFFIWKDKDNKKEFPTKQIEVVDTVATQKVIDSAAIKKAEEERLIKEQEEKEATQKAKIRKHHIIVGSFKNEANAKKLLNKLKSKGFENATSFSNNSLIMVSATSFESLIEAREAQEKFLQEYRMENWIMTRK
jgi:hypothetical protein